MEEISHPATVIKVGKNSVTVVLQRTESCGSCKLRDICNTGSVKEQKFEVFIEHPEQYACGQKAQLLLKAADAGKAVFWAYGLPLLLLLVTLFGTYAAGIDETASALAALAVLPPYYFALYLYFRFGGKKLQIRIR